MSKHTKGPWTVSYRDDWEAHISMYELRFKLSGSWESAVVVYGIEERGEEGAEVCKANARLIAAAPELYEALKDAAHVLNLYSPGPAGVAARDAERRARAALLKASPDKSMEQV